MHKLVEAHGGSIQVQSAPGQGSRFSITLAWSPKPASGHPAAPPTAAAPVAQAAPQAAADAHSAPPLILLAEDNEQNVNMLYDYLISLRYRVVVARNGGEAIAQALELRPDLILMDIQMPGIDGFEATRRIRAESALHPIPIIALTALAMPGDRERCLEAGASDYLTKPVSLRTLQAAIDAQRRAAGDQSSASGSTTTLSQ